MKRILFIITMLCAQFVSAQSIEFVVSAAAAGPNDIVTRKLVEKIEKASNINFVVVNKPGAAHRIGYSYVLSSTKPTLILSTPEIAEDEVYSQIEELFNMGYFYNKVYVSEKSNIKSMNELINLSKNRDINFGHGGVGTFSHSAMETLCSSMLKCLSVPYKSGAQGMLGLLTGEIDAYALVSYGNLPSSEKYIHVYDVKNKEKYWFKLFAKNVSEKDKDTILKVLKSLPKSFYTDMGFDK